MAAGRGSAGLRGGAGGSATAGGPFPRKHKDRLRQTGQCGHLGATQAPAAAPQPASHLRRGQHTDMAADDPAPAQTPAVHGNEGADGHSQPVGDDLGLPPGRAPDRDVGPRSGPWPHRPRTRDRVVFVSTTHTPFGPITR